MRPEQLLAIDAAAEMRNLCQARLQGSWQVPAELVRLALARGARKVEVRFLRRGFEMHATGAALGVSELGDLARAVSRGNGKEHQHRAILNLEASAADPLLFVTALDHSRATLRSFDGRNEAALRIPGGEPTTNQGTTTSAARWFEVRVCGSSFDTTRAATWLREACRFTRAEVIIDGHPKDTGFRHGLFRIRLEEPLPCQLAVTRAGDTPRLFLLHDGLISTQASIPGYPAFEAAVEMSQAVEKGAPPARLREAVTPHLPELIDQAVAMLINLAPRLPHLDDDARRRITSLLLRAARQGLRRREILELTLVEAVDHYGRRSWQRISEILSEARRHGGSVPVLGPEQEPERFVIGARPTLILGADERSDFTRITDLRLEPPPPIKPLLSLAVRLRRRFEETRVAAADALSRVFGRGRGRVVDRARLSETENNFLDQLTSSGASWRNGNPTKWSLCTGRGGARRGGPGRTEILLPRNEPLIRRCIRAVAEDSSWIYPVLAALHLPDDICLAEPRSRWSDRALHNACNPSC